MYTIILRSLLSAVILMAATAHCAMASFQTRIVGGNAIDISAVPATVALLHADTLAQTGSYFQSQFCGGTLISPRWVLTAAHCMVERDGSVPAAGNQLALTGSTDLDAPLSQPIEVIRIIRHPGYQPNGDYQHDIALLELAYDASAPHVALDTDIVALNDTAFIAGWGALNDGSDGMEQRFPTRLQGAYVHMVPGSDCGTLFSAYAGYVNANQVCAGVAEGGIDSCQGDSGGPLYRVSPNGRVAGITGITSWGIGCAGLGKPGIYTRVGSYVNWISQNTGITAAAGAAIGQAVNDEPIPGGAVQGTTPISVPGNASNNTLPFGPGSGGGASGYVLLPLLGLLALLRRRDTDWYYRIISITALGALTACSLVRQSEARPTDPMDIDIAQLPLGSPRIHVAADAEQLWQSAAVCTIVKTGYAAAVQRNTRTGDSDARVVPPIMDRRAYFLETCAFANTAGHRVCGALPARAEYRFFEGELVQVAFEYDDLADAGTYTGCLDAVGATLDTALELSLDEQFRTTLSNRDLASRIPLLRSAL